MAEVAGRVSPRSRLCRRVRRARGGVLFAAALLRALPAHGRRQLARLPAARPSTVRHYSPPPPRRSQEVSLKKYLYVFRPLLACRWIQRQLGQVPMLFAQLVETVLDEADVRAALDELVARKQAGEELAAAPPVEALSRFNRRRTAEARGAQRARRCRRRSGRAEWLLPPLRARA